MSPLQFRNSEHLKKIKQQFLNGEKPNACSNCWKYEEQGLHSIRQHYLKIYPEYSSPETFSEETELPVKYMELRTSNLCNFSCRMCNVSNSSEIQREVEDNPKLVRWFGSADIHPNMIRKNWNEVLECSKDLTKLILTGGEPFLMKEYHTLLEHIIENKHNKNISLLVYTNCSVYNPKFINILSQFGDTKLCLSIDATGEVAEYQRYGTKWNIVYENVIKFSKLPFKLQIHSSISAYTLLDFSSLVLFYKEILSLKKETTFVSHIVLNPNSLHYSKLNGELRKKAIEEIELSISLMDNTVFDQVKFQLISILDTLNNNEFVDDTDFINMTRDLDISRGQNFNDTFGLNLY